MFSHGNLFKVIKFNHIMEEQKLSLEKVAFREHITTDMGNGGSYCSNCKYNLGSDPSKAYEKCPRCDCRLREGGMFVNRGGSDF